VLKAYLREGRRRRLAVPSYLITEGETRTAMNDLRTAFCIGVWPYLR
jgi:hypothetical protein